MRKMKILIVDDNDTQRKMLSQFFSQKTTAKIVLAENGEEAWKILEQETFDIIISDNKMPIMNGIELLKKVRSDKRFDDKIFWLLTGDTSESFSAEAKNNGADNVFIKPSPISQMVKYINQLAGVQCQ